jgi:predicted membrane channel-forming protein YqfA (hemolysin III family)
LTEPATTLTDVLLALLGLALFVRQRRSGRHGAAIFFAALSVAAVFGALSHGFLSNASAGLRQVVWWITLVCTGATAAGLALIGLECLGWGTTRARLLAVLGPTVVFAIVVWFDPRFRLGLMATGIGGLVFAAGVIRHARRYPGRGAGLAALGIGISVVAGVLQQRGVAVHPVHFDHNATYHVIIIPALLLLHAGTLRMASTSTATP